jgi:hypothetical protein
MYDHCQMLRVDAGAAAHGLAALEGNVSRVGDQEVLVPAAQDHAEVMSRFGGQAFGIDEPEGRLGAVLTTAWHLQHVGGVGISVDQYGVPGVSARRSLGGVVDSPPGRPLGAGLTEGLPCVGDKAGQPLGLGGACW